MMILEQVGEDIWVVDGPEILFLGLTLGTRMTVVRLGEELWVHSPVSITNEMEAEIERLGKVRYIVAPNRYHHIFLPEWRSKFPEAGIFAAPGLTEKRPDIAFDGELTNTGQYNWSGTLPHAIFGPSRLFDEVIFFHTPSRTLILTDLIVNVKTDGYSWWQKLFAAFDGLGYPDGTTPRLYRWSIKSKSAAKAIYQVMIDWEPEKIVISHGEWFREGGTKELTKRLGWVF
jgi:hypothetical protein